MYKKLFWYIILLTLTVHTAVSQTIETAEAEASKKDEKAAEFRQETVNFLRETSAEIGSLRTLENRISFASETAGLMWFHDENEARIMFQRVINDFRELLVQYDAQISALGVSIDEGPRYYGGPFSPAPNEKAKFMKKFYKAMAVRQQISLALAEHDPVTAYDFYISTSQAVTNVELRKQIEQRDSYFEVRLLSLLADKDPERALEMAKRMLEKKGVEYQIMEVLKKIYAKDEEKGAELGAEIVKKLKAAAFNKGGTLSFTMVLEEGVRNLEEVKAKKVKRPMFSEGALRDLAETLAQTILEREKIDKYEAESYLTSIEKLSPARAAQIRRKFSLKAEKTTLPAGMSTPDGDEPPPSVRNGVASEAAARAKEEQEREEQQKMMEDLKSLADGKLSDEQKQKFIAESRKVIAEMQDRTQRLFALNILASQVARLGDKELASQIMNQAQGLVNPAPRNYRDYTETWFLASGYAQVDANKAFPLIEETIYRLNETISAFIKVGEFIDVDEEIIEDGEVQVGSFGGEITKGLFRELGAVDTTLISLAQADFKRTKALANKFDRQEVRVLAKMLILRAVLGNNKASTNKDTAVLSEPVDEN